MTERLIDSYDAALFDLDGVVYLGPIGIDGAAEGIADLRALGVKIGFVTNNAARPPATVSSQLTSLGIPCEVTDVVTSGQAGARLLAEALPAGSKVLITGTEALADEAEALGFVTVDSAEDHPQAVLQGYDPQMTQPRLDEAGFALQGGARWFATNTDPSRPTERGQVPGAGTQIDAVGKTVPYLQPEVAGKPFPPLLFETIRRIGVDKAIFVGDRVDTDIEGANNVDMESLFVFTGTHKMADLVAAPPVQRPTAIGWDLRALLAPARQLVKAPGKVSCGEASAVVDGQVVRLESVGAGREAQLDALWAILDLAWGDDRLDATEALASLDELR